MRVVYTSHFRITASGLISALAQWLDRRPSDHEIVSSSLCEITFMQDHSKIQYLLLFQIITAPILK